MVSLWGERGVGCGRVMLWSPCGEVCMRCACGWLRVHVPEGACALTCDPPMEVI